MPPPMFKIREPTNTFNANIMISVFIYSPSSRIKWIFFRDTKFSISTMNTFTKPQPIIFD